MLEKFRKQFTDELERIRQDGLYKHERIIQSPQGAEIVVDGKTVVNFCANNYLGLANDPVTITAAQSALERWGYGLSSVRFICGTQAIHAELETALSKFMGTEETILYSSCFDANGGIFEVLTNEQDVIVSDRLNHASIIDGIRLSKAQRAVYEHMDMPDLERQLKRVSSARRVFVVTDGVFSMDGDIAPLDAIVSIAERYGAMVIVDDSHATGFVGPTGRGTAELHHVSDRVDIITSTLGKALGGATGGFISGRREIIDLLRQRSRPYLFSNSLSPVVAATSLAILEDLQQHDQRRQRLWKNTERFRTAMSAIGLPIRPGQHPIVPVMFYDAQRSSVIANRLLELGIYVISFSYPVVPKEQARIRVQLSAAHSEAQIDHAVEAFKRAVQETKDN